MKIRAITLPNSWDFQLQTLMITIFPSTSNLDMTSKKNNRYDTPTKETVVLVVIDSEGYVYIYILLLYSSVWPYVSTSMMA